jgi:hypothetical protein
MELGNAEGASPWRDDLTGVCPSQDEDIGLGVTSDGRAPDGSVAWWDDRGRPRDGQGPARKVTTTGRTTV